MIKWLLKKSIWATEVKKWHGMSHNDESDVFHTFSSSFSILRGSHLFLGKFYIFSGAFWETHDFLKEAQKSKF